MPRARTKHERELLSRAYAICSNIDRKETKERCVKKVYKSLKKNKQIYTI